MKSLSGVDPGFPMGGLGAVLGAGMDLRHGHFLVKMYVKMKELGPVRGHALENFVRRSANVYDCLYGQDSKSKKGTKMAAI